tara:strand:+ start:686 stop:835 length:150 start_codon:yes stop_codon:yes gene_type:complete
MFNLEKTLLLARAAYYNGYIKEAIILYKNLLSLQPNHIIAKKELKKITA